MSANGLQSELLETLSEVIGLPTGEIPSECSFFELGLDSIKSIDFVEKLNEKLHLELGIESVFDHTSILLLEKHIKQEYPSKCQISIPSIGEKRPPCTVSGHVSAKSSSQVSGRNGNQDIAIVGMAGRFPGANTVVGYWRNLQAGKCSISEITRQHLVLEKSISAKQNTLVRWGGLLDSISEFDAAFFGISPLEAEQMDPQQRIILEESYKAIESAGYDPSGLSERRVGVFVGVRQSGYLSMIGKSDTPLNAYSLMGNDKSILASRLSYFLNLKGVSLAVDTACSSSLVAIHKACQRIAGGESGMGIAGGVFVLPDLEFSHMAYKANML